METPKQLRRLSAIFTELWLDVQAKTLRRRERQALIRIGTAAASAALQETGELKSLIARLRPL